jgi:hypothetical protein
MKSKENLTAKPFNFEKALEKAKPKSLRPMRSIVASRSFKPKTQAAHMILKIEETVRRD